MLVFIYDELMSKYENLKLPFTFLGFAFVENVKLYWSRKHYVMVDQDCTKRKYGNNRVYGILIDLQEPIVNIRVLDAYYGCSKSRIFMNNDYDLMHRHDCKAFPITFNTLDDFASYKFKIHEPLNCQTYLGNKLDTSLNKTIHAGRKRSVQGLDTKNFIKIYDHIRSEENARR